MRIFKKVCYLLLLLVFLPLYCTKAKSHQAVNLENELNVEFPIIAYYTPWTGEITREKVDKLDQIIYSFLYLRGNRLHVEEKTDSVSISYLTSLKKLNPELEVLVSLGGWGGCETCSEVFSSTQGREEFALSVQEIVDIYDVDGIDLDWEYPAVPGYPGHAFKLEDRENFTLLVRELRNVLGKEKEITFAAGSSRDFIEKSIQWDEVMPLVDGVNMMTYDFTNGSSAFTGHHSSLYSTTSQDLSADSVIRLLDSIGVPRDKIVIGAAFYARIWENVPNVANGLNQMGDYKETILYKDLEKYRQQHEGFKKIWDSTAKAAYLYNPSKNLFVTYDDSLSVALKTNYAIDNDLKGLMFWQLAGDKDKDGLLEVIYNIKEEK